MPIRWKAYTLTGRYGGGPAVHRDRNENKAVKEQLAVPTSTMAATAQSVGALVLSPGYSWASVEKPESFLLTAYLSTWN